MCVGGGRRGLVRDFFYKELKSTPLFFFFWGGGGGGGKELYEVQEIRFRH